ncbi:hypothetical protein ACTXT7_006853 [Hymenolepis weldensis]
MHTAATTAAATSVSTHTEQIVSQKARGKIAFFFLRQIMQMQIPCCILDTNLNPK